MIPECPEKLVVFLKWLTLGFLGCGRGIDLIGRHSSFKFREWRDESTRQRPDSVKNVPTELVCYPVTALEHFHLRVEIVYVVQRLGLRRFRHYG